MPFDRYNDMFVLSKEPHSNPKGAVCFMKKSLRVDCDEIQAACLWWGNVSSVGVCCACVCVCVSV